MPALQALLKGYVSGKHSFLSLSQELNSQGHRTSDGKPFTESSISTVLNNRFYRGDVVCHRGKPDEEIFSGAHEVPDEIRESWERCQEVRRDKNTSVRTSPPSRQQRVYPLSAVLVCDGCGQPFHGIGCQQSGKVSLRMAHSCRLCDMRPQSVSAPQFEPYFADRVLVFFHPDEAWRASVFNAMFNEVPAPDNGLDIRRIDAAIANLRKQHVWDVISDQEFKAEYQVLQRQRRALEPKPTAPSTPNLDRAAELLQNLPALWKHPGVTQDQRRELVREVFDEIRLRGGKLVAVKPRPEYVPLFAYSIWKENQYVGGERST